MCKMNCLSKLKRKYMHLISHVQFKMSLVINVYTNITLSYQWLTLRNSHLMINRTTNSAISVNIDKYTMQFSEFFSAQAYHSLTVKFRSRDRRQKCCSFDSDTNLIVKASRSDAVIGTRPGPSFVMVGSSSVRT